MQAFAKPKSFVQVPMRQFLLQHGVHVDSLSPAERWDAINRLWLDGKMHRSVKGTVRDKGSSRCVAVEKAGERVVYAWAMIQVEAKPKPESKKAEPDLMIPSVLQHKRAKQLRKEALKEARTTYRLHLAQNGERSALRAAQSVIDRYARMLDENAAQYASAHDRMPYQDARVRKKRRF